MSAPLSVFRNIPHYTRQQLRLQRSFAHLVAESPAFVPFPVDIVNRVLAEKMGCPCSFHLVSSACTPILGSELHRLFPKMGGFVAIQTQGDTPPLWVVWDNHLAFFMVDKLLGGNGDSSYAARFLTDIEMGILTYLFLYLQKTIQAEIKNGLNLSFQQLSASWEDVALTLDPCASYAILPYRVHFGATQGQMRILFSERLLKAPWAPQLPDVSSQKSIAPEILSFFHHLKAVLTIHLAKVEIGDIILLENHQLTWANGDLSGEVFVRVNKGKTGGFYAKLLASPADKPIRLEVVRVISHRQPEEICMDEHEIDIDVEDADDTKTEDIENEEAEESTEEEALSPAAQPESPKRKSGATQDAVLPSTSEYSASSVSLLDELDAPIVVELGRLRMTAAQIAALKPGSILKLARNATDPVDLVVGGRILARGTLLDVDGEIGVRLLELTKG
jgi:flagellar motor switch protein FliM